MVDEVNGIRRKRKRMSDFGSRRDHKRSGKKTLSSGEGKQQHSEYSLKQILVALPDRKWQLTPRI